MASEAPIRQHRSRLKDFYGIAETAASKSDPTHEQSLSIDTAGAVPLPVKTKTQHVSIDNPLNLSMLPMLCKCVIIHILFNRFQGLSIGSIYATALG